MWDCRRSSVAFKWNCIYKTNDYRKDWDTVARTWPEGLQTEEPAVWGGGEPDRTRDVHLTVRDVEGWSWKDMRKRRQSRFKPWRLSREWADCEGGNDQRLAAVMHSWTKPSFSFICGVRGQNIPKLLILLLKESICLVFRLLFVHLYGTVDSFLNIFAKVQFCAASHPNPNLLLTFSEL